MPMTEATLNPPSFITYKLRMTIKASDHHRPASHTHTAALRRTARYGDVWFPIGNNPRHPLDTVARLADGVAALRREAAQQGRDPASIGLAFYAGWFDEALTSQVDSGERRIMSGTAAQVAQDIEAIAALGFTDLVLNFQRATLEQSLASMQHFVDEIRPLVASGGR